MRGDAALLYILHFLFLTARCDTFNRPAKTDSAKSRFLVGTARTGGVKNYIIIILLLSTIAAKFSRVNLFAEVSVLFLHCGLC